MEVNKRFTVKAQAGAISDEGVRQIRKLIAEQKLTEDVWKQANPDMDRSWLPSLPEDWAWVWLVTDGDYRGTFPKRVSQFYFKQYGIKLIWALVSELGNLARLHSTDDVVYEFEFVNRIDWHAGDFGDRLSCYWTFNSGAREILRDNGALAVRFYGDDGKGIARAWVVEIEDNLKILFNGYGFSGDPLRTITLVVAEFLKVSYRKIEISNYGRDNGTLWLDDNGRAFILGPADLIATYDAFDLEWDDPYTDSCQHCGDALNHDDLYYGPDDLTYCEYCAGKLFDTCEKCYETHWREDIQRIENQYLCRWCAEQVEPPARESKK